MKAFSEDIVILQNRICRNHAFFSKFLSLTCLAPRNWDTFRLQQDLWVFLKFLQVRSVPEALGHQNFLELLSCVISCITESKGCLPHLRGPLKLCFKKSRVLFFLRENLRSVSKENMFCINDFSYFFFVLWLKSWQFQKFRSLETAHG